jgi:hypothetical protein
MFLGRSAVRRIGCFSVVRNFTGWGVSEDGVFQRKQRFSVEIGNFTVDAAKHRMGPFREWPSFRGYGSMYVGRSEFHRMGRFRGWGVSEDEQVLSRDWHFTVDAAKHRMGSFQ